MDIIAHCVYISKLTSKVNVIVVNGKGGAGVKWYLLYIDIPRYCRYTQHWYQISNSAQL